MVVTSIHDFFTLQLHQWQNCTKLSAVWWLLLQWRHLSPGPWHQPAFLSVSHCLMGEGKWGKIWCSPLWFTVIVPFSFKWCTGKAVIQITKGYKFLACLREKERFFILRFFVQQGFLYFCRSHCAAGVQVLVQSCALVLCPLWHLSDLRILSRFLKMSSLQSMPFWTHHITSAVKSCWQAGGTFHK